MPEFCTHVLCHSCETSSLLALAIRLDDREGDCGHVQQVHAEPNRLSRGRRRIQTQLLDRHMSHGQKAAASKGDRETVS